MRKVLEIARSLFGARGLFALYALVLSLANSALAFQVSDVKAEPVSPWGKIYLQYSISGVIPKDADHYSLIVSASNRVTGVVKYASKLSGETTLTLGSHRLIWDLKADGLDFSGQTLHLVVAYTDSPLYQVIELSEDQCGPSYRISGLGDVPTRGWSDEYKTTKIVMKRIESGSFLMRNDGSVTISKSYYMGIFEVSQRQWELVTGLRPSCFTNESYYATRPVDSVSYNMIRGSESGSGWPTATDVDSDSFLGVLRKKTGLMFDLPTEAQWEYACRAGTTTDYNNGTSCTGGVCENMNQVGRYLYNGGHPYSSSSDCSEGTAKVGSYLPNTWGLYDMHGNVNEWCLDWWQDKLTYGVDPIGATSGTLRILRGGGRADKAFACTSSSGSLLCSPSSCRNDSGLRLARSILSAGVERSCMSGEVCMPNTGVNGKEIELSCSPLGDGCVLVQLNGKTVMSSSNAYSFVWQPLTKGEYTLTHKVGTNEWSITDSVMSIVYESETPNPTKPKDNDISITPTTRDIAVCGEGAAILVSGSSVTWTASVSDSWIRLGATSGNVGYPVSYMVDANTNVEERVGYVYVSGHVHTVKQAGWGGTISSSNKEFECDGGYGMVNITAQNKMVWHARPNVDWLSVTPTSGAGNGSVTYQVAPWHEVSTRSGTLTIAGQTFTVFQYGKRMKLEQTTGTCNYETHVFPITVNALAITKWSVTPNNSWISVVDGGNGQGSDLVTVAVGENPSYKARTGTVTIGTETFTITQEGRTDLAFSVSPTETTASVNGANGLVSVFATPDLPWMAASQANWLTVMAQFKSGSGNGNVVYTASPNPTLYQRMGTITVTPEAKSGLKAKTQTVTQPAAQATISLTGYEFAAAGESVPIDVTVANIVEWGVANLPSWLTASKTSFVGPGTVTLQASQNETVYSRSATIKIAEHNFVVTQKARGVEVEYDTKLFKTDGGSDSISVHPDGKVSWTAVASDPTWIVLYSGTSGTGDGEVLYIVAPYVGTGEPRTGTITIGDQVIYITQRAYDLTIDPYAKWVTGNAGAGEIGVSASIGDVWTAIVTAPWIKTIDGYDAGTGSGTVRFVYEDNDTGKTRTGKIVIAGEVYTLTQAARTMVAVTATVEGGGTVSGAGSYVMGTDVSLTAVPDGGWEFKYWSGDVSTMQNPITVTADVAKSVTAVFGAQAPEFTSSTADETGVMLTWTNLAWAVQYKIYRAPTSENVGAVIATVTADGTHSYVDTTGDVGTTYWYWVEAIGADVTTESKQPASGAKKAPIVISSITYTNLRGATHSNTNAYREGTVVSFSLPQGGPVGYTFAGWSPAAITADMTGNQTVTANWTANAYSVTYHANGGSGTMKTTPMTYDVEGLVASNEFTFAGHRFVGWATSADGEVVYAEGAAVSNLTASVGGVYELWAKWAECKVEVPTIAPANGSFFGTPTCMVTLSCATEGATIYCRTGGGSPKVTETYRYKGPFTISDTTIIKAFATKDGWTQSEILEATLTQIDLSLEAAIDVGSGVTVTTGGDTSWETAVDDGAKTGGKCAQSGAISDGEESWIQLAVSGAGTMTFWTKVSCEADEPMHEFDHLAVYVDGVETTDFRLDGESDWVPRTVTFTTAGSHTVKVAYEKDESDAEGEDCAWLDGVVWTPSAAPADPIPDIGDNPTAAEVAAAVAGATDPKVTANIDETNYNAFRDWAGTVKVKGGSAAGAQGVMASETAWMSFALGQDTLLDVAPTDEDLSVETFTPSVESGKFDFTVSVKDIEVGSEATKENLKKVFGLEGAATLDGAAFSSDKVDIEFATPVDGNVKFKAGPKDADAKAFFMKVKLNP